MVNMAYKMLPAVCFSLFNVRIFPKNCSSKLPFVGRLRMREGRMGYGEKCRGGIFRSEINGIKFHG